MGRQIADIFATLKVLKIAAVLIAATHIGLFSIAHPIAAAIVLSAASAGYLVHRINHSALGRLIFQKISDQIFN
jgi:hypothetical protein